MNVQTINKAVRLGLLLTCLTVLGSPALAQSNKSWTAIGSTGTVEANDLEKVETSNHALFMTYTCCVTNTTAIVRYNVTATDGLLETGFKRMRVIFADNGNQAQVKVKLKALNLTTGSTATLLELDSNDYAPSWYLQSQVTSACGGNFTFNFGTHAYFIEAELIRGEIAGLPYLSLLQLFSEPNNACLTN